MACQLKFITILQPVKLFRTVFIVFGYRLTYWRHYRPILRANSILDHGLGYQQIYQENTPAKYYTKQRAIGLDFQSTRQ